MNIIEAFREIDRGETVVDPRGGIWVRDPNGEGYVVRWPDGRKWDVPRAVFCGEWRVAKPEQRKWKVITWDKRSKMRELWLLALRQEADMRETK